MVEINWRISWTSLFAAVGDAIACEDLGGEQRRPCHLDLGFGAGPFAPFEGIDCEFHDELIGRNLPLSGRLLDVIPMLGGDAGRSAGGESDASPSREWDRSSGPKMERARAPKSLDRDLSL